MMFPLSPAEDRARLPVCVLTGFLGSGKTTLLNHLLRSPRMENTAVAINEFGAVPLDQHLIDHGADKTVVLANGCLCCNVAGDMEEAVMRIFSRRESGALPRFDRLVVELSGLADPAPIAQAILRQPLLARAMRLEAIVTVVDGVFGARHLTEHPEARTQAELADVLLVSKADLADPAPAQAALRRVNGAAPIHLVAHGQVDPDLLFAGTASPAALTSHQPAGHRHGADVAALSLLAEAPLDWGRFDRWLRSVRTGHADDLLRVKGILHVAGRPRPVVIQGVHHVLHPPAELPAWPDADQRSRLVLILRGAELAARIEAEWREQFEAQLGGVTA